MTDKKLKDLKDGLWHSADILRQGARIQDGAGHLLLQPEADGLKEALCHDKRIDLNLSMHPEGHLYLELINSCYGESIEEWNEQTLAGQSTNRLFFFILEFRQMYPILENCLDTKMHNKSQGRNWKSCTNNDEMLKTTPSYYISNLIT